MNSRQEKQGPHAPTPEERTMAMAEARAAWHAAHVEYARLAGEEATVSARSQSQRDSAFRGRIVPTLSLGTPLPCFEAVEGLIDLSADLEPNHSMEVKVPIFNCGRVRISVDAGPESPRPDEPRIPEAPVERRIEVFADGRRLHNVYYSRGELDSPQSDTVMDIDPNMSTGYWLLRITNESRIRRPVKFSAAIYYPTNIAILVEEWETALVFPPIRDLWEGSQLSLNRGAATLTFPAAFATLGFGSTTYPLEDFSGQVGIPGPGFDLWTIHYTEWPHAIASTTNRFTARPYRTLQFEMRLAGTPHQYEIMGTYHAHMWNMVLTVNVPLSVNGTHIVADTFWTNAHFDFESHLYNLPFSDDRFHMEVKRAFEEKAREVFRDPAIRRALEGVFDLGRPASLPASAVLYGAWIEQVSGAPRLYVSYYVPPPDPDWGHVAPPHV